MSRKPVVAVIGSGGEYEPAVSHARQLGEMIAANGWILISGGRNAGVMKAANEGAKAAGGVTIGILPDRETEVSPDVDVAIITGVGEARNNIIVLSANVIVACGIDDPGTASEAALALKAGKLVILLGSNTAASEFFGGIGPDLIHIAETPKQAIEAVKQLLPGDPASPLDRRRNALRKCEKRP